MVGISSFELRCAFYIWYSRRPANESLYCKDYNFNWILLITAVSESTQPFSSIIENQCKVTQHNVMDSFLNRSNVFKYIIVLLIEPLDDWYSEWNSRVLMNGWKCKQDHYHFEPMLLIVIGINEDIGFKNVRCREVLNLYT